MDESSAGTPHDSPEIEPLRREVERLNALAADHRAELEAIARRSSRLERITAALTAAATAHDVSHAVTSHGVELFGADATLLFALSGDGRFLDLVTFGGTDTPRVEAYQKLAFDDPQALPSAVRTGEPIWLASHHAIVAAYPELAKVRREGARLEGLVALPLRGTHEILGGLACSFYTPPRLDEVQRNFFLTVASQCGLALERARLLEAEREANRRLERQKERLAVLARATEALSASLDSRHALAELTKMVVPTLADWCAIDELTESGAVRRLAVAHRHPDKVELIRRLEEQYPPNPNEARGVPHVIRTGVREFVPEIPDALLTMSARDDAHLAIIRSLGLTSYAVVPIRARGRVLGALTLVSDGERRLFDDDVEFAEELARRAALALENARLYEAAREHADTVTTINELGKVIAAELDVQKVVQAVTDAATQLTGAQFGAFFYNVPDDHGGSYMLYTISGVPREQFSKFPMPRNTAIFAPTFAGEGIVRVADITQDPRYGHNAPHHGMPEGHLPVRSYLAVPVLARSGAVIGGIFLGHAKPGVFTERAESLVAGLAAQAAIAMDNARLYGDAQRLIKALEGTNRELDQFAYVTSHDLKAPLRGIGSLAEWIEEDVGPTLTDDARRKMSLLRGRVRRMEGLIQGILDYSRAARSVGKREEVDVGKLVLEVAEMQGVRPPAVVTAASGLPVLFTERVALQQVLLNLVGNALKHAGRTDAQVRVEARDAGDVWEIRVVDNGPGLAAMFHERVWGIFQTLEARDSVESTGIGLSIVKKIVEARGGRAWIESAEGQGATFAFTWPKKEERKS